MVRTIDDLLPRELANRVKLESNTSELQGVSLIDLIEKGLIEVVGETEHGALLYRQTEAGRKLIEERLK